jgi:hypothetical protein
VQGLKVPRHNEYQKTKRFLLSFGWTMPHFLYPEYLEFAHRDIEDKTGVTVCTIGTAFDIVQAVGWAESYANVPMTADGKPFSKLMERHFREILSLLDITSLEHAVFAQKHHLSRERVIEILDNEIDGDILSSMLGADHA